MGSLELMRAILGRQLRPEDILDLEDEAPAETGNVISIVGWRQSAETRPYDVPAGGDPSRSAPHL
jgi:hypothetical protein